MEKPDTDQYSNCLNCQFPLPANARYCPSCGQKCTDGRVSFGKLVHDFFENVFNLDSKIFVSLAALFIPGKLTIEYFKGRHKHYLHPLRILLASLIVFITCISYVTVIGDEFKMDKIMGIQENFQEQRMQKRLDSISLEIKEEFAAPIVNSAVDSLNVAMAIISESHKDSINLDQFINIGGEKSPKISNADYINLSPEELIEKYNVKGFWNTLIFRQKLKFINQSNSFLKYMIGRISWGLFIMIPLFSLALKLVYIRRDYYYVEHFIFSTHVHAFLLLLLTLVVMTDDRLPKFVTGALLTWMAVYIVVAQKRVYQQRYLKTLLKFSLLTFMYLVLLFVSTIITIVAGFLLF